MNEQNNTKLREEFSPRRAELLSGTRTYREAAEEKQPRENFLHENLLLAFRPDQRSPEIFTRYASRSFLNAQPDVSI